MTMTGKEVIKLLKANGWMVDRVNGSHWIMVKGDQTITVPVHSGKALKQGTLASILKQAGLK